MTAMPLAFESLSHGTVAFGFFNIESDMLLCDRCFFFADDFCRLLMEMADTAGRRDYTTEWPVHVIERPEDVGDLMGAIHGVRFTGFLGALYRRIPFPPRPEDFKQNPEGFKTRPEVADLIGGYGDLRQVSVCVPAVGEIMDLGDYRFSREQFQALIHYVWRGGYPRWKDETRPPYVMAMAEKLVQNRRGIFEEIEFNHGDHRD
jgi:hypothetical protein